MRFSHRQETDIVNDIMNHIWNNEIDNMKDLELHMLKTYKSPEEVYQVATIIRIIEKTIYYYFQRTADQLVHSYTGGAPNPHLSADQFANIVRDMECMRMGHLFSRDVLSEMVLDIVQRNVQLNQVLSDFVNGEREV